MPRFVLVAIAILVLAASASSARAGRNPGSGGLLPAKPLVMPLSLQPPPKPLPSRYAMTYSETVARRLGVEEGRLNLAPPPHNPYMPRLSVDGGMLRLRWRP